LVRRDRLAEEQLLVVGAPVEHAPASALHLQQPPVALRIARVHHVDVAIAAVAPGGPVGETVAAIRPADAAVLRPAVRQQGDGAPGEVVAIDLAELVAADVAPEEEELAPDGREGGGLDA